MTYNNKPTCSLSASDQVRLRVALTADIRSVWLLAFAIFVDPPCQAIQLLACLVRQELDRDSLVGLKTCWMYPLLPSRGGSRISLRGVLVKERAQILSHAHFSKNHTDLRAYSMVASATDRKIMLR